MALAKHKNRKQAESAYHALKEVFTKHLLQDDRKLYSFQHNPNIHGINQDQIANFDLIEAYYDHCIKELYREYVNEILLGVSKDDLEYFRKLALTIMVDLISSKPEIEEVILGILINKLGDLSKKVQQHTIGIMCRLLKTHPEMATIIVHETNLLLQRPGITPVQKYYSVAFLNKIAVIAGKHNTQARLSLFRVYFFLFKNIMQNPEELKKVVIPKDRTKSKKDRMQQKAKEMKRIKQVKANGDIDQSENKIVEQVLKGINVLMTHSKAELAMGGKDSELKKLLEEEMNMLFKLTHHNVFRIQI